MPPNAGTLRIQISFPDTENDYHMDFFDACCSENVPGGCNMFYSRRPIDDGTDYFPPVCCGMYDNIT